MFAKSQENLILSHLPSVSDAKNTISLFFFLLKQTFHMKKEENARMITIYKLPGGTFQMHLKNTEECMGKKCCSIK